MILVFATSSGVVMEAATPPATAPHTAPCHGKAGDSCTWLHLYYRTSNDNNYIIIFTFKYSQTGYCMNENGISLSMVEK